MVDQQAAIMGGLLLRDEDGNEVYKADGHCALVQSVTIILADCGLQPIKLRGLAQTNF